MTERCGHWMPLAQVECALNAGHSGFHRTISDKVYRQAHRERFLAYIKDYRETHREEIKATQKAYYETHREEIRAAQKAWAEANPDKIYEAAKRRVENGSMAASAARSRRRKSDERCDNLDPRLETLLGGLIGPSKP